MTGTELNIATIEHIFQAVRMEVFRHPEKAAQAQWLEYLDSPFFSIAFESASFEIANRDLTTRGYLSDWYRFRDQAHELHSVHMDYGLGWAIAAHFPDPLPFVREHFSEKVAVLTDGMGYYYALYKPASVFGRRSALPAFPEALHFALNTGIGRRIWYRDQGNHERVGNTLSGITAERLPGIWQGIGIASAYVGGNPDTEFMNRMAGEYQPFLQAGRNLITPHIQHLEAYRRYIAVPAAEAMKTPTP